MRIERSSIRFVSMRAAAFSLAVLTIAACGIASACVPGGRGEARPTTPPITNVHDASIGKVEPRGEARDGSSAEGSVAISSTTEKKPDDAGTNSTDPYPEWARPTSVNERLQGLRVSDDNWARRILYSWTTRPQIDAMRATRTLLVATATTNGPPSPFVFMVETLSHRKGGTGVVAGLLAKDARFTKRRYAWTNAFATVLGLSLRRYGDELVRIRLRENAWVVEVAPEHDPPIIVRDLEQHEVPLDRVQAADAGRIAAVYHVRLGKDVPARFREYVIVNEAMVERWSMGTPEIGAEAAAEALLVEDVRTLLSSAANPNIGPPLGQSLPTWLTPTLPSKTPPPTLRELWQGALAFDNVRYVLDAKALAQVIEAMKTYDKDQPAFEVMSSSPSP